MQHPDEAIEYYEKAIGLAPEKAIYYANLGLSFEGVGKLDEALNCYERAMDLEPTQAKNWYNLILVLTLMDRYEEATEKLHVALDRFPNNDLLNEAKKKIDIIVYN